MDLSLPRRVEPELLDRLAAGDPRAQRSRNDLRRIHRAMATLSILQRALDRGAAGFRPRTVLELGAGDGSLMLRLARRRAGHWPDVRVSLLDRLNLVAPATLSGLRELGWTPRVVAVDVFDWLASSDDTRWDMVVANLFMHHFSSGDLARLLSGIAARSRVFFCCEPGRSVLPLAGSHLIGLLGAGPVTRRDAVASVHAGFRAQELSELWPKPRDCERDWILHEYSAGLFSHCFLAISKERASSDQ
jgi:methyltransferase family protein